MEKGGIGDLAVAFGAAFNWPAISRLRSKLRWRAKYLIALLPVSLTFLALWLAALLEPFFDCPGNSKGLHDCHWLGFDFSWLTGFDFFMVLVCMSVVTRLSCGLVLRMVAEEYAVRDNRNASTQRYRCCGRFLLHPQHRDVPSAKSPHVP